MSKTDRSAPDDRCHRREHLAGVLKAGHVVISSGNANDFDASDEIRWKRDHFVNKSGYLRPWLNHVVHLANPVVELIARNDSELAARCGVIRQGKTQSRAVAPIDQELERLSLSHGRNR